MTAAAQAIWEALGDPGSYIDPFAGSLAALLARPGWQPGGVWDRHEVAGDADGMICNLWRSIRHRPATVARYAAGPLSECDLHAIDATLASLGDALIPWLEASPSHCDPALAGWWLRAQSMRISGAVLGGGRWAARGGRLVDTGGPAPDGIIRALPQLAAGRSVSAACLP